MPSAFPKSRNGLATVEQMLREDAQQLTGAPHRRGGGRVGHRWGTPEAKAALAILASARRGGFRHTFIFSWCVDAPARAAGRRPGGALLSNYPCHSHEYRFFAIRTSAGPRQPLRILIAGNHDEATMGILFVWVIEFIKLLNAEYERAKERGQDYILALVYGLEEGERTEARLIFDPTNSLALKPVNGIRLVGLADATALVLHFNEVSVERID